MGILWSSGKTRWPADIQMRTADTEDSVIFSAWLKFTAYWGNTQSPANNLIYPKQNLISIQLNYPGILLYLGKTQNGDN